MLRSLGGRQCLKARMGVGKGKRAHIRKGGAGRRKKASIFFGGGVIGGGGEPQRQSRESL